MAWRPSRGINRGVSTVLGYVLIAGFVALGTTSLVLVGMAVVEDTSDRIGLTQAEDALERFAADVDGLTTGETTAGFRFQGGDEIRVIEDGQLRIVHDQGDTETEVIDTSLNALVYRIGDARLVYQSGGIWRVDDTGEPLLLRPPSIEYRATDEGTMLVDAIRLKSDYAADVPVAGTALRVNQSQAYPTTDQSNPLENGTVRATIESQFCPAWTAYFEQRTAGAVVRGCDEGTTNQLTVQFSVPFVFTGADKAVIEDPTATPVTWLVEAKHDACGEIGDDVSGEELTESRLYCTEHITGKITANTTAAGGDIEIYVDDTIDIKNSDITVTGAHNLTLYVNGSVTSNGNAVIGNQSDPTQTRLFFSANATMDKDSGNTGTPDIYGLLYGPESSVYFGGDTYVEGAIVAANVTEQGSPNVVHDEDFEDLRIVEAGAGPPFYYLNVDRTDIDLRDR